MAEGAREAVAAQEAAEAAAMDVIRAGERQDARRVGNIRGGKRKIVTILDESQEETPRAKKVRLEQGEKRKGRPGGNVRKKYKRVRYESDTESDDDNAD